MRRSIIYRDEASYSPWPVLWPLPDGSIGAGVATSQISSHPGVSSFGEFLSLISTDEGTTWHPSNDPADPATWPAATVDEQMDRFATIPPDGAFITVGSHGFARWDADRLDEAQAQERFADNVTHSAVTRWTP